MKKDLSIFVLLFIFLMFSNAQEAKVNNIVYHVVYDNTASVGKNFSGDDNIKSNLKDSVFIQSTVLIKKKEYKVTAIDDSAFFQSQQIPYVKIGDNVTEIGQNAFSYCNKLTSILIPANVTKIGTNAFAYCNKLVGITVQPDNPNYSASDGILYNKDKTSLMQYPAGNPQTSFTIPSTVTSIDDNAFKSCNSLTAINIPAGVISIGKQAFMDCSNLANINVDPANPNYTSVNGILFDKNMTILINYPRKINQTSYSIPQTVTKIDDGAFYGCSQLTEINIPENVVTINEAAFYNCKGIATLNIPKSLTTISKYAFCECDRISELIIPDNVTTICKYAFASCDGITYLETGNGIKFIDNNVFYKCPNLKFAVLGTQVMNINDLAFAECSNLETILYFNEAAAFSKNAYKRTSDLKKNHIKYVPESAYRNFQLLKQTADKGDDKAQFQLGLCYFNGNGIVEDKDIAYTLFNKSASKSNAEAQYYVGYCLANGYGTSKSIKKAVEWYNKASSQNHADAQLALGNCYLEGNGVDQNYDKAIIWLRKAKDNGNNNAQKSIDVIMDIQETYNAGLSDIKAEKYDDAIKMFSKVISKYENHVYSYINRGYCYTMLGNYNQAKKDFNSVLKLEPSNTVAKDNLTTIKDLKSSNTKLEAHSVSPVMMQMNY